ncbi:phosphatase PAP2 family protein [Pedobacter chinensis]|uniref:Phosphatase PAP2 family protein n=1 Tax=Pedobacter chinensis TaxID=2282421 RepID=A0A369PW73_9SPHI|nr:phosphatase PAP2 family protein [Pedobacter chinensis]RDC56863.1 phosphatase PAP2 family protein [Pedobacter chinensis]
MKKCSSNFLIAIIIIVFSQSTRAQRIEVLDSSIVENNFFKSKAVRISAVPVILLAGSAATWGIRKDVREFRNRYLPTFRYHYDDYLQYAPVATVFALNAAGVKGKHKMGRTLASYAFSAVIMASVVNTVKYSAKVERPDGSTRNSFPSGHTANSFMNATLLHKEYGQYRSPLYSIGAYTAATATAVGRELNNRHWISDVLAGAGIGILSTEVGYVIADKIFKERGEHIKLNNNPVPVSLKPSFIELRLGYAEALSKDLTNKNSGLFAKRGFNFGLESAWFFSKNIGIGGEFAFSSFPMNDDELDFDDPDIATVSNSHYTQPMGIRYIQAGPYFSVPLPRNWFITGKLTAGRSAGAQGEVILKIRDEYQDIFQGQELPYFRYKPESAFGWSVGLGIQKQVKRNIGVKAYVSYFDSDNDFSVDIIDQINAAGSYTFKNLGMEKVRFNHITFGLGLTAFLW